MATTILTVDDAATIRKMVAFTLKAAGHEVLEAGDGLEAIKVLGARTADVIISDINMPNLDGIELTRRLRAMPAYARTPIILLTTESDAEKKAQGRAAGATGWIVKPFNQEQLLAIVNKVLAARAA
jgi:two-component system chemotaxis response regulator CheY